MRYQARENKDFQGVWIVEALDLADGDSSRSILFYGFEARAQAEAYAAEKNPATGICAVDSSRASPGVRRLSKLVILVGAGIGGTR